MICSQCQSDNPERAKFCLNCGQKLVLVCPGCGTELPSQARFCFECGQPLAKAESSEPEPDAVSPASNPPPSAVVEQPVHQPSPRPQQTPLPGLKQESPIQPTTIAEVIPELSAVKTDTPSKQSGVKFDGSSFDSTYMQTFLPRSRLLSLASGIPLPKEAAGTCLFADISGFTPLSEALGMSLEPQHGAEVLTGIINQVFEALISQVHRYGGEVLGFAGDAITCWFSDPIPIQVALSCALSMLADMDQFSDVGTPDGGTHALSMKVGVAHGPAKRLVVGAPRNGLFDLMAGNTLTRVAEAEHLAQKCEVVCAPEVFDMLADAADWGDMRDGFRVLNSLQGEITELPSVLKDSPELSYIMLRPYFPPAIYDWLLGTQGRLLAELRPVLSAFVRVEGLDYESDPQVEEKLDQYVRLVQRTAMQYGGNLVRLDFGDKGNVAHVIFGAPVAHEDDDVRAVGWALELQNAVRKLTFIKAQYIGITKGQVYAGALGAAARRGYTLMGDEVNASARLMQACQPDQILVSQRVMQAAQKRYTFHQFPGFQVKGKYEPIPVGMPVALLPSAQQVPPTGPLVGRENEIAHLTEALDALSTGTGQVLRLEGQAGIGKSRLVSELIQRANERGVRTLLGIGSSIDQNTPYLPWREILQALFGLQSAWPAAQQAMQMQNMLQWINADWLPRLPLLGDLLGLEIADTPMTAGFDARMRQQSLFALLGDILSRMADQQPLLIAIENCQWIDQASAALIEALALSLGAARVLLVVAHRPRMDPNNKCLSGLQTIPNYIHLHVNELPPQAVRDLATSRLGGELPGEILDLVQERAQGNPFIVEELVETLRELGRLQMVDGRWTLTGVESQGGDLSEVLKLPDTIQGVVLARLDRLDEGSKLTLKVSSVVGRKFEVELVAQVHPAHVTQESLDEQLEPLEQRDFLLVEQAEPQEIYRFKHNVTQEVTYETLLYAQRRELHQAIAEWIEDRYRSSLSAYYPLLVHHYQHAGAVEKEQQYARLAGEQAAQQFANADALRYLGRALELTSQDQSAERFAILSERERVYDLVGEREIQAQDLEMLNNLAEVLGDDHLLAEVALRQAHYKEEISDMAAAIDHAQRSIQLAQGVGDLKSEALGFLQWGRGLWQQGDYPEAREKIGKAMEKTRGAKLPRLEADCLRNLGIVSWHQGDYMAASSYLRQAQERYHDLGDLLGESMVLGNLGIVAAREGDYADASTYYEQMLQVRREIGHRQGESNALSNLGIIAMQQGDFARSRNYYQQAVRIFRQLGNRLNEGITLNNLGFVLWYLGGYEAAREHFEKALLIAREIGAKSIEGMTLSNLGLLAPHLEDVETGREFSQQALQIAQDVGDRSLEGEALTHLAHALVELDQLDDAAEAYRQAAAIREELGEEVQSMESLAGLARVALAQEDIDSAMINVEKILAFLENQTLDGAYEPIRVYLTCYQALKASQDGRASEILVNAHDLLQGRAALLEDEGSRRTFLENVEAHRELLEVYDSVVRD